MKYQLTLTEEEFNTILTALKCELVNAIAKDDHYGVKYLDGALKATKDFKVVKEG